MEQQNFKKYFIIYFIVFGISISLFSALSTYIIRMNDIEKSINTKAQDIFDIKTKTILIPAIENMNDIVNSLRENEIVKDFIITKSADKQKRLEELFFALMGIENRIMKTRIIDKDGKELIRVDRKNQNGKPFIVKSSNLQDKSNRDYFQAVSKMSKESIWHSKLDLNIENNKIEIPYNPTIRIAAPLLKDDEFIGMVIVNILTKELFDAIGTSSSFKHYIIDKDRNFILHPDETYSFSKYKNLKRELKEDFPNGLNAKGVYAYPIDYILKNEDEALFVLKATDIYEKSLKDEIVQNSIIVLILTVILSIIASFYASKAPAQLQISLLNAHKKLKEYTSVIDKYIITATTKPDSTIIDISSAFTNSSGYSKSELIGQKMSVIKNQNRDKAIIRDLWKTICSKKIWIGEIKNRKKDGTEYWLEQHVIPILDERNTISSIVSIGIDITSKKELEKFATIDKLTDIYNRRRIDEFLQIEMEVAKRHSQPLSLILVDIDHFKLVNDTYGHQVGDLVLSQTTKIISQNLRKSDIFGRWGGEEFLVICPQTNKNEAFVLAEKLRNAIETHEFEKIGHKTICLGISELEHDDNEKTLVEKVDKALYEAKNGGRNKTVIFT
jgi:diguanylate cyclase (GGDEF)-like protein/PAS domain S-box-containing protein